MTTTVSELEAALAAAKQAERDRQAAAVADAKARAQAVATLAKNTEPRVAAMERQLAGVKPGPDRVPMWARVVAREWLRGQLTNGLELMSPEHRLVGADATANAYYSLSVTAAHLLGQVGDFNNDAWLPADHPVMVRIDTLEYDAWTKFINRVRVMAGEK